MNNLVPNRIDVCRWFAHWNGVALLLLAGIVARSPGAAGEDPFAGLEPRAFWGHFADFTRIPRQSGNEGPIARHVLDWAAAHGFDAVKDAAGNVIVRVPASAGRDKAPVVIIQGHLDMVCSRDEAAGPFDPAKGNIRVIRVRKQNGQFVEANDGEYVKADKTTLGADCGLGCSAMMTLSEDRDGKHGPLDLLFTVEEETGLRGAQKLDTSLIRGRICLNVDADRDGVLIIGGAGGLTTVITSSKPRSPIADGEVAIKLTMSGLRGGHSGVDIHKGRLNAIKAMGHVLQEAGKHARIRIATINGGDAFNAIPREADAIVLIPAGEEAAFRASAEGTWASLRSQYKLAELGPKLMLGMDRLDPSPPHALTRDDSRSLVALIQAIPSGVLAMSQKVEGLVETSNNLGVVRADDRAIKITCNSRSSVAAAYDQAGDMLRSIAELAGAIAETSPAFPGWDPDPNSAVVSAVSNTYRRLHGASPKLEAIHGGLECGVIASRIPGLDAVSMGANIQGPHSDQEAVVIATVAKFYRTLVEALADLSAN